ncbi:Integrator Complex Subunit 6 [Manis pentadactyla]|nr:Integrator Complex Subunit 6 [Manis pentadactyla]
MPILLFMIGTSASMNQRSHLGTTYLDTAKGAVETFMKLRARDPASGGDRLVTGIDNYGQGRNPFFLEPAIIITITDGSKLTTTSGVQDELHLPLTSPLPGSELTKEPFCWDQRLFMLVLQLPGTASGDPEPLTGMPLDDSAIKPTCEVTGGRSYSVCSPRMLNQCLESLVQKVQSGVVINFEKAGPDPSPVEDG